MRNNFLAAWVALAMASGCAGVAGTSTSASVAAAPRGAAQASWTDKITAPFTALGEAVKPPKAPKVDPTDVPFDPEKATPELYVRLAQMSHRGGDVVQARQLYQKALAKDPQNLEALLGAARMEDREGRLDVAHMLYKRAADAHPRNTTALNDLALCAARRGDLPAAHASLDKAVGLAPGKPLYRNNIAKVLVEMNQLDVATRHLAAVHPPAVANYNMAVLLNDRGRAAESAGFLRAALAIDPQMQPAHAMLAQLTAPPAPAQAVAQSPPASGVAETNDSILPTPESVAAAPSQPTAGAAVPAPTSATPAPVLLPPVN